MVEAEVRKWIREVGTVVVKGMTITDNTLDDTIAQMFFSAVDSDLIWPLLWPLIDGLFEDSDHLLKSTDPLNFSRACMTQAINPLVVLAIIQALIDLWKKFRK